MTIQTLGGFTSPPSDEDPEYYDVKLVFKPLHDTGSDKNTIDGVQEFMVRGVLGRDPCDANKVRSVCVCVCACVCVCVCVCVDEMEGICSIPVVMSFYRIK
jgi:hypothetical protein